MTALVAVPTATVCTQLSAAEAPPPMSDRPNVLFIVSDDHGIELSCYGDPYVKTPHMDRLAEQGVRFERAFVTYAVCSPSRASFYTGLYTHQNGHVGLATHKFSMYGDVPNLYSILRDAGYRTGMIGKLHVNPESAFPIDFRAYPGFNFKDRPMRGFADKAAEFINASDEPFFLTVNYPDPHTPWLRQQYGLPEKSYEGKDIKPPPWVGADSPRLRELTADYYNCVSRLDTGIGMLLDELESSGKADNTLVIYIGDHGPQFSRAKMSVFEASLHIPLIVRWPGHAQAGLVRRELVTTLDILPTILQAAGVDWPQDKLLPQQMPGQALQPLLEGGQVTWRTHVIGLTTGAYPGAYFPQFSIRDDRYKLIMSPLRDRPNPIAAAYMGNQGHYTAGTQQQEIDASSPLVQQVYDLFLHVPYFELYDVENDPYEYHNLAADPQYASVRQQLFEAWWDWARRTRFPLADKQVLDQFTAEQDNALKVDYRKNPDFQWHYLETFWAFMTSNQPVDANPSMVMLAP
ncbi:MAG: sulfatase [Phycisphaeraceae bacterium]|nr:sulfatase [Phycisphaeraceae bacterium]